MQTVFFLCAHLSQLLFPPFPGGIASLAVCVCVCVRHLHTQRGKECVRAYITIKFLLGEGGGGGGSGKGCLFLPSAHFSEVSDDLSSSHNGSADVSKKRRKVKSKKSIIAIKRKVAVRCLCEKMSV